MGSERGEEESEIRVGGGGELEGMEKGVNRKAGERSGESNE